MTLYATGDVLKQVRIPVQNRSKARVKLILDVTEAIILESGWEAATAHMIAKRADIPPAGVYHFFPDRFAVYSTLLERYLSDFDEQLVKTFADVDPHRWEDLVDTVIDLFVTFLRENDCARILALGGASNHEMRWFATRNSDTITDLLDNLLNRYFDMPDDGCIAGRLSLSTQIIGAGLFHAARVDDRLDDWSVEETKVAVKTYMATWLGAGVKRRGIM